MRTYHPQMTRFLFCYTFYYRAIFACARGQIHWGRISSRFSNWAARGNCLVAATALLWIGLPISFAISSAMGSGVPNHH
jgi:hypothetical protein